MFLIKTGGDEKDEKGRKNYIKDINKCTWMSHITM